MEDFDDDFNTDNITNDEVSELKGKLNNNKNFFKFLSDFNTYMKDRMDFLADIATSKLSNLENPMLFYNDIIKNFDNNKLLLNRISGLESSVKYQLVLKKNNEELAKNDDFYISMPNDVLGCHAFYIILENIIRNICKHTKDISSGGKLNFQLCVNISENTDFPNYYKVEVYPIYYKEINSNKFSELIEIEEDKVKEDVADINKRLNQSILDPTTNSLRETGLGTIEMDICAAYLRKRDIVLVDSEEFDLDYEDNTPKFTNKDLTPNFLYATTKCVDESSCTQYSLCYNFHFRKPRQILIIDPQNKISWCEDTKNKIEATGVWLLNNENNYKETTIYGHDIVVFVGEVGKNIVQNNNISLRQITISENDIKNIPNNNDNRAIELFFWQRYFCEKQFNARKITCIGDEIFNINKFKTLVGANNCVSNFESDKSVYIDDHSDKFSKYSDCDQTYYETGTSNNSIKIYADKLYMDTNLNQAENKIFLYRYFENIATKLVVIDERIQANLKDKSNESNTISYQQYFEKQNLFIPLEEKANLNVPDFGKKDNEKSENFKIRSYINEKKDCVDFIVIHLGILEKMLDNPNDKTTPKIQALLEDLPIDTKKLVITSGRGKPDNLPNDIKFVPLASVQKALEVKKEKYLLTQLLYNARKYKYN
jgi:hypothetical protein